MSTLSTLSTPSTLSMGGSQIIEIMFVLKNLDFSVRMPREHQIIILVSNKIAAKNMQIKLSEGDTNVMQMSYPTIFGLLYK